MSNEPRDLENWKKNPNNKSNRISTQKKRQISVFTYFQVSGPIYSAPATIWRFVSAAGDGKNMDK